VIDGYKRYITNSPIADVIVVFARTNPDVPAVRGISAFLVPTDLPGVSVGPRDRKMGQKGEWTADVALDSVRVPATALVGEEGIGCQRFGKANPAGNFES
jgi:acyl-CoA dehydrogenase